MASVTWVVLLCAAAVWCIDATRIVGGDITTIEQYPSIVQVESRSLFVWSQTCAANLLTNIHLLSAAYCFDGLLFSISNRRIRAGTTNRGSGGTVIGIASCINHPSYEHYGFSDDSDISVLRLESALVYNAQIQPVAIVAQGFELPENLPVVHAGWGTTTSGGIESSVLRDVSIFTVNHEVCRSRYNTLVTPVTDNMICAGLLDVGGKGACQSDIGGPLYYDTYLVGIFSWSIGCGDALFPGVSTKISAYTDWIVANAV